jgi:hypothetical protein
MSTPLYKQYRTIRATMQATGQSFKEARTTRNKALRRSEPGRRILAHDEQRRTRQRERWARLPLPMRISHRVRGLPPPQFNRDYSAQTPYAVVVNVTFREIDCGTGEPMDTTETLPRTFVFDHKPSMGEVENEVRAIADDLAANDNHVTEDATKTSDPQGTSCWIVDGWEPIGYYVSRDRL